MAKRKVCRKCKVFVEGSTCAVCNSDSFTDNWQGRIYVSDVARSQVAGKVHITVKGEYAIKVR